MKHAPLAALALSLLTLTSAACSKNIDTLDAVKQGVIRDIPKDINLQAMDVNVISVSFRGKEADAVVAFAPKGGPAMMNMKYTMERKGDEWHIKSRATGTTDHAGQDPTRQAGPQALPPGHPAGGAASPGAGGAELPSGHPPLGDTGKK